MMRSLFSGVSGLKVHQTKLDVIGNNIANVNTVGFRGSTVTFSDVFYQTSQSASGPNAETGTAGRNAMQIGLGTDMASVSVNLSGNGSTQRTDRGLDLMINGDAFFVVNSNGMNYFTKAGHMDIDAAGTMYCKTNGATVMGWQVDALGNPIVDQVSPLRVMSPENSYIPPEATTNVTMSGNISRNGKTVAEDSEGYTLSVQFFDNLGESYMASFKLKRAAEDAGAEEGTVPFTVTLSNVTSSTTGESLLTERITDDAGALVYQPRAEFPPINWGGTALTAEHLDVDAVSGAITILDDAPTAQLLFNVASGQFVSIGSDGGEAGETINFNMNPDGAALSFPEEGIDIDFSKITMYDEKGETNVKPLRGDADRSYEGAGRAAGRLEGIAVSQDGLITGTYSNGDKRPLGMIAVATFPNPSGLEAVGSSMFAASMNSGEFDGVGVNINAAGGEFSVGALEMSNVDLATEFTTMITTQRGFQANSRIITTSDTMLEELINLKR
ncbi:MAG: flagellar hook protein FlgE [Lachnoclostridium sp.]|nr:flagellar hook protein FlgE [Lachnoclostridium sp.]